MTTEKTATKRIILDFSSSTVDDIDTLKDKIGMKSRTELIRYALGLLALTTEQKEAGFKMQFRKDDEIVTVAMPIFG